MPCRYMQKIANACRILQTHVDNYNILLKAALKVVKILFAVPAKNSLTEMPNRDTILQASKKACVGFLYVPERVIPLYNHVKTSNL